jgi:hypothetical protein
MVTDSYLLNMQFNFLLSGKDDCKSLSTIEIMCVFNLGWQSVLQE